MPRASKSATASPGAAASGAVKPVSKKSHAKAATAQPNAARTPAAESGSPKAAGARSVPSKAASPKTVSPKAASPKAASPKAARRGTKAAGAFLADQRALLVGERVTYLRQAEELKAQADSLALEHEPGDVQFDEEGGEGGTSNVDRELDLVLSAQARAAIEEIDRALLKMDGGTYGRCERCGEQIPEARLQALPHAALCVACKSGGLSSRR